METRKFNFKFLGKDDKLRKMSEGEARRALAAVHAQGQQYRQGKGCEYLCKRVLEFLEEAKAFLRQWQTWTRVDRRYLGGGFEVTSRSWWYGTVSHIVCKGGKIVGDATQVYQCISRPQCAGYVLQIWDTGCAGGRWTTMRQASG